MFSKREKKPKEGRKKIKTPALSVLPLNLNRELRKYLSVGPVYHVVRKATEHHN